MENFEQEIKDAARALHWLGKYTPSNALTLLARASKALKLESVEDLELWVSSIEKDAR